MCQKCGNKVGQHHFSTKKMGEINEKVKYVEMSTILETHTHIENSVE